MPRELYLHIGFPKTATSVLQRHVFPVHGEFLYLGRRPQLAEPANELVHRWRGSLKRDLLVKDVPYFSGFSARADELEHRLPQPYAARDKWLISDEIILSACLAPYQSEPFVRINSAYYQISKLAEMSSRSLRVRLIIVLRNQAEFLHSLLAEEYRQFSSHLGIKTMTELIDYLSGPGDGAEIDGAVHFSALVEYCDRLLGRENVLVLPYELMKDDPQSFLEQLACFMTIEKWNEPDMLLRRTENRRRLSDDTKRAKPTNLRRTLFKLKRSLVGRRSFGLSKYVEFTKNIARARTVSIAEADRGRIRERYAESNRRLAERVRGISKYRYW